MSCRNFAKKQVKSKVLLFIPEVTTHSAVHTWGHNTFCCSYLTQHVLLFIPEDTTRSAVHTWGHNTFCCSYLRSQHVLLFIPEVTTRSAVHTWGHNTFCPFLIICSLHHDNWLVSQELKQLLVPFHLVTDRSCPRNAVLQFRFKPGAINKLHCCTTQNAIGLQRRQNPVALCDSLTNLITLHQ